MKSSTKEERVIISLIVTLIVLVSIVSITGLIAPGFYAMETQAWKIQTIWQDAFDLFGIVPLLTLSLLLIIKKNIWGTYIWGGINSYLLYTFTIYCFDIQFNSLFVLYCIILGVTFYSLVIFLSHEFLESLFHESFTSNSSKSIGIFFISLSVLFAFLWLSDDLAAIGQNRIPDSLLEVGLPTNPVHILDLAIFLPGLFVTGILLLKKSNIAFFLAPLFLIFLALMSITIAGIIFMTHDNGLDSNTMIGVGMLALAAISSTLFVLFVKQSLQLN